MQHFMYFCCVKAQSLVLGSKSRGKTFSRETTVPYTLWWRCYIERYTQR